MFWAKWNLICGYFLDWKKSILKATGVYLVCVTLGPVPIFPQLFRVTEVPFRCCIEPAPSPLVPSREVGHLTFSQNLTRQEEVDLILESVEQIGPLNDDIHTWTK